jgi:hypothetical protein
VDPAYDTEPWSDFAVGMAGAAAALAGLLFVAVSINIQTILASRGTPGRAAQALISLALPVFISLVLLVPAQSDGAVAIELLVISAVVGPALGWLARPGARAPQQPRTSWLSTTAVPSIVIAVAPAIAAVGLLTHSLGGLYWLPAAVALALLSGLVNAWVLMIEILR